LNKKFYCGKTNCEHSNTYLLLSIPAQLYAGDGRYTNTDIVIEKFCCVAKYQQNIYIINNQNIISKSYYLIFIATLKNLPLGAFFPFVPLPPPINGCSLPPSLKLSVSSTDYMSQKHHR